MLRSHLRAVLSWLIMGILAALSAQAVLAHAQLAESSPNANAVLESTPSEIRLRFTEPLESDFSRISLIDAVGNDVELPNTVIDAADNHMMYVPLPMLGDGLYTINWRVVSAADGHPTQGSFPFLIGGGAAGAFSVQDIEQPIPIPSVLVRWVNFFAQALTIGSIGFWLFVWTPALPSGDAIIERRMSTLIWLAWVMLGLSGALILLLQVSLATGVPINETLTSPLINQLVSGTRFGQIWVIRIAFWFGLGGTLYLAAKDRWYLWVALLLGAGSLLTTSLFSHASAAPSDVTAAIVADWMHIGATALWVGGLIQFVSVIIATRRYYNPSADKLAALVGYFSNFARVAVAGLVLTGLFAAWLHVNTLDALLTTTYGNLLVIKLGLFVPLFGLAAINLIYTQRGLNAGRDLWGGRLRSTVTAEIVLTVTILGVVGAMTSIAPAKGVYDARVAAQAAIIPPNPITETLSTNDINAALEITPGYVGSNTFTLTLRNDDDQPVADAQRIRMLFRNMSEGGGESELRFEPQDGGIYSVTGANISLAGSWRLRITVAREGDFDRVYDFRPTMIVTPTPSAPVVDPLLPIPNRVPVLLAVGLLAIGIGGFFLGESRWRIFQGAGFVAIALLIVGVVFLASSMMSLNA